MSKATEWYLKKKNDTQYGPVSLHELMQWARECRIVAGNQISQDQQSWIAVEDVPELEMDWFAERHDGKRYGPFPLGAVRALVEHRVLPREAILTHRKTDKTLSMDDALEQSRETESALPNANQHENSGLRPTEPKEQPTPTMPHKTEKKTNQIQKENMHSPQKTESGERGNVTKLQQEITDLQKQIQELIKAKKEEAHTAEEDIATLHAEFESLKTQAAEQHQQAYTRQQELASRIEELQEELEKEQNAQTPSATMHPEQEELIAELRQQVAFMKKNTAALHAQLSAAQQTAQQRAKMLSIAWVVVTIVAAGLILSLFSHGCQRLGRSTSATEEDTPVASDRLAPVSPDGNDTEASTTAEAEPPPNIDIEGIEVLSQDDNTLSLRFEEGIFSRLDTLSQDGQQLLDTLARELPRGLQGWQLIIEGHTDDIPLRSTSAFENNEALAYARAEAAARHFQERAAYPQEAIRIRAGTTAPFPNDSTANRRRNRTVTLKIQRK